jgi:limonene-1,2-epoxide hydrolase
MGSFPFLFRRYELGKVFTPSSIAKLTYVSRSTLESDVEKYLQIPGMQIVLYGYSGCGKSTLIHNKLMNCEIEYISTSCTGDTNFNELIYQAFDKLDMFYLSESSSSRTFSLASDIKAQYLELSSKISQTTSAENTEKKIRILPVQLTPERLAEFLGAVKCVWIIEDYHKVPDIEKRKIADVLKIFMDAATDYSKVKIICIGAVATAGELVELDPNLSSRVAEIYIPLLSDDELHKIVETGFGLMNLNINKQLIEKIVYYSNNVASICHQLCYDICYGKKIKKSNLFTAKIVDDDFTPAVISYLRKNSYTINKLSSRITTNARVKAVLNGIINTQKESVTFDEIFSETQKIIQIRQDELLRLMLDLQTSQCGEVIRYDQDSKLYSFSSVFFQTFLEIRFEFEKDGNAFVGNIFVNEKLLEGYLKQLNVHYQNRLIIKSLAAGKGLY